MISIDTFRQGWLCPGPAALSLSVALPALIKFALARAWPFAAIACVCLNSALVSAQQASPDQSARAMRLFGQAFEFFQAGEFDAAGRRFNEGLALDPQNGIAHYYLAETYVRENKRELAHRHYSLAKQFSPPESKEAGLAAARLENFFKLDVLSGKWCPYVHAQNERLVGMEVWTVQGNSLERKETILGALVYRHNGLKIDGSGRFYLEGRLYQVSLDGDSMVEGIRTITWSRCG